MADPTLTERLTLLEADVATLGEAVTAIRREAPSPVWSWLATDDPESARAILADLTGWVHAVWLAWPDAHLPDCWMRHPDIVETLWVLRNAWSAHEQRGGSWAQRLDWIERHRPLAAQRIQHAYATHQHDDEPSDRHELPSLDAIHRAADEHCNSASVTT